MLIKALYDFAQDQHLLDEQAFDERPIRWVIPIDLSGRLVGDGLIDTSDADHKKGAMFPAPRTIRSKGTGGVAEFLADGLTSVFGADADPSKVDASRATNNAAKCQDFWEQIERCHLGTRSPVAAALSTFKQHYKSAADNEERLDAPFLRWGAGTEGGKPKWWIKRAGGDETPMGLGDAFTFQVEGRACLTDPTLRAYWANVSQEERRQRDSDAERGLCLVTGRQNVPVARSHPKIEGLRGGIASGCYLVSFSATAAGDACSFASFGWAKGCNAPIAQDVADGYAAALSTMLADRNHSIVVGPVTTCFWARQHADFSAGIAALLNAPLPETVAGFFKRWFGGVTDDSLEADRFNAITLSGNAGRAIIRDWLDCSLTEAARNLQQWFGDLDIQHVVRPVAKKTGRAKDKQESSPLAIFRLACSFVRDPKDLATDLVAQIYRAALAARPLPAGLLKPLLHRFRCDLVKRDQAYPFNPSRFAILKLILTRLARHKENAFMPSTQLVTDTADVPYNLGRFLAVLEALQDKAHEYQLDGAGVIERYYGTASSAPGSVFPLLCRLARHHLRKLEKQGEKGRRDSRFIEIEIQTILAKIKPDAVSIGEPPRFPRVLNLEQQGRFALGFYQQKAHTAQAIADAKTNRDKN